jgi:uncharacterized protein (AIM24 family)
MSEIRANSITDAAGTGAPDFPNGITSASIPAANLTGDVAAARITGALNASGSAPMFACRAWVNFNGTGTVAIRASGNVSSITDNGTGDYTVNFTTAMQDANYAVIRSIDFDSTGGGGGVVANPEVLSATTGSVRVAAENISGTRFDVLRYEISIFR